MSPIHRPWAGGSGHVVAWASARHMSAFAEVQIVSSALPTVMPTKKSKTLCIMTLHSSDRHAFETDMKPATMEVAAPSVCGLLAATLVFRCHAV